jgi:hypothetical protein
MQRPANFVNFCVDELKEIQRVTEPQSAQGKELPPVQGKKTPTGPGAF